MAARMEKSLPIWKAEWCPDTGKGEGASPGFRVMDGRTVRCSLPVASQAPVDTRPPPAALSLCLQPHPCRAGPLSQGPQESPPRAWSPSVRLRGAALGLLQRLQRSLASLKGAQEPPPPLLLHPPSAQRRPGLPDNQDQAPRSVTFPPRPVLPVTRDAEEEAQSTAPRPRSVDKAQTHPDSEPGSLLRCRSPNFY